MRRPVDARTPLLLGPLAVALALAANGCDRNDEPVASTPTLSPPASSHAGPFHPAVRDKPPLPPIKASEAGSAAALPAASRDPDMGLDARDPARDYVDRYLRAVHRYGEKASCVVTSPSVFDEKAKHDVVEAHNDATRDCGKPNELRDRFFVTVATDHLSADPSLHQPKLERWPDGSDPEAPAGKVADVQDLRHWKAGLRDSFHKLELAPLRVQLYGRGTYPIVTIAGWHGPVLRTMTPEQLEGPAKSLCEANGGEPIGIFAALDRATILRISCPGSARFESL